MIIDRTKTDVENLVELIRRANSDKPLQVDQVTFGTPVEISGHVSEENTSIMITPVVGHGMGGPGVEDYYSRLDIANTRLNPPASVTILEADTGDQIREKIAAAYNWVSSEVIVLDDGLNVWEDTGPRPTTGNPINARCTAKVNSLLYIGNELVVVLAAPV